MPTSSREKIELVAAALESYASRGVFRGFSRAATSAARATFRVQWHRGQTFDVAFEPRKNALRFAAVLPEVTPEMFADLGQFIAARQSEETVEHRRIDPTLASVELTRRGKHVDLTIQSADLEYAVRKLVALVHEIYLVFLHDGKYYDYLIATFNLDPDYVQFS